MNNKKALAILGGMGPQASSYMYDRLISLSMQHFAAENNDDFPEIIIYSIPVPDFISDEKNKIEAYKMLMSRVIDLNKLDIFCLSIACNTAHVLLPRLQKVSQVPFVSMIKEVVFAISQDKRKCVGILGTPATLRTELYQNELNKYKIRAIVPNKSQIRKLNQIIRNVIKGQADEKDLSVLLSIADCLKKRGAEAIILGCTELPLIFPLQYKIPVYNSVEILSMALLRRYYESNTINTS